VAFFEGPLQHALHRLKYKRDIILADSLAGLLCAGREWYSLPGDTVIPVPLSAQRLRERGYNQAGLLARGFAELAGLTFLPRGLERRRETRSQVGLSADERRSNVAGAFTAQARRIGGRSVLLIDDVCTTGATLMACAEALHSAGARQVWGLTLGRAR
jgi:ComF family protein